MIIDIHTHLTQSEYAPDSLFAQDLERLGMSQQAHAADFAVHEERALVCDRVVVFGLDAKNIGLFVPNDTIAEYARRHPDQVVGFASVNPAESGACAELERAVTKLGLRGLKLGPIYQDFDPRDRAKAYPVYEICAHYKIPIMFHMGTTFSRGGLMEWSKPACLEKVCIDFPDLKLVVAHLAHPWEGEAIALIRRQPNVYADVSALYYRPWQFYNSIRLAYEYKMTHKLLFGTDFPFTTVQSTIEGMQAVCAMAERAMLPELPWDVFDGIIHRNSLELLGVQQDAGQSARI
jgi:uncharacterized protein